MNETLLRHNIHDKLMERLKSLIKRRRQAIERRAPQEVMRCNAKIVILKEAMTEVLNCQVE